MDRSPTWSAVPGSGPDARTSRGTPAGMTADRAAPVPPDAVPPDAVRPDAAPADAARPGRALPDGDPAEADLPDGAAADRFRPDADPVGAAVLAFAEPCATGLEPVAGLAEVPAEPLAPAAERVTPGVPGWSGPTSDAAVNTASRVPVIRARIRQQASSGRTTPSLESVLRRRTLRRWRRSARCSR